MFLSTYNVPGTVLVIKDVINGVLKKMNIVFEVDTMGWLTNTHC